MGTLRTRLQEMGAALYRRVGGKSSSRSQRPIPYGNRCPLAIPHSQSRTRHSQSRTGDAGGADSRDGQVGIGSTESYKRKETQRFFQPTGRTMNHLEENHELSVFTPPLTNTGVHARQWIERILIHQPNKRGIAVGVPDSTTVCRMHGSEEKYSENQTSTHQRPRTAHRQRRQRRNGLSSLRKWIAVSNRLPLRRPEPITRTKPTSTRYWRRVSTTECYGTRNSSRRTRLDITTT